MYYRRSHGAPEPQGYLYALNVSRRRGQKVLAKGRADPCDIPPLMKHIRTAARAVIIDGNRLLVIAMRNENGPFYILPGGGQLHGETLHETLRREGREELGADIEPGPLLYVREYRGCNHTFARAHRHFHQLEVVFQARLSDPASLDINAPCGPQKDNRQEGLAWLELDALDDVDFFPAHLKTFIRNGQLVIDPPAYLGDIN